MKHLSCDPHEETSDRSATEGNEGSTRFHCEADLRVFLHGQQLPHVAVATIVACLERGSVHLQRAADGATRTSGSARKTPVTLSVRPVKFPSAWVAAKETLALACHGDPSPGFAVGRARGERHEDQSEEAGSAEPNHNG
jgi:hypothetical protein